MTSSNSVSLSRYRWYMRVSPGMADGMSGKPLWMASTRSHMAGLLAVAERTSSHVTDLMSSMAVDAQICEQRGGTGASRDRRPARISLGGHVGALWLRRRQADRESRLRSLGVVTVRRLGVADAGDVDNAKAVSQ